jgi:hypothetical protein
MTSVFVCRTLLNSEFKFGFKMPDFNISPKLLFSAFCRAVDAKQGYVASLS